MDSLIVNGATYWLPQNTAEVIDLVNEAITKDEIICMRGSAHSFPLIGTLEKNASGKNYKYIMLSKMYNVAIDQTTGIVKVDAGCHLGLDPWDPTNISTLDNSLLYKLNLKGWAIPDLGGITHQTVGGFLSTASSGGSTTFSFEDTVISIDLITTEGGKATLTTFNKPANQDPDDPFYGVGVATMGLMGVIVSATFQCVPSFYIAGQETTKMETDCEIDLFGKGGNGKLSLQDFLQQTQYTRLMWWPQASVNKMVVWKAWQCKTEQEAMSWASAIIPGSKPIASTISPYEEVPYIGGTPVLATVGADILFTLIGTWPNWLLNLLGDTTEYRELRDKIGGAFYTEILPKILGVFVQLNDDKHPPQKFSDIWYNGIPMDNQMSDRLFPVWFTELWIDIDKAEEVMNELHSFYQEGPDNTGAFSCEIYAAKANQFWLSPSYGHNVIRIDVFWFAKDNGDPTVFYDKFWKLLAKYHFRPHWGKYLPKSDSEQGISYLKSNYPKWDNWMELRKKMDPCQVFVNDYWRDHLGIPAVKK